MPTSSLLPASQDSRLLAAGVVAILALLVYLSVAYARTHTLSTANLGLVNKVAPWTPFGSDLAPVGRKTKAGYTVRVTPAKTGKVAGGTYGAVVQTLVSDPQPGRYLIGLWLKGTGPGRIGVELNEFSPGVARYPVETTVPARPRWRHFTFRMRVKGSWLGLAVYVYRADRRPKTWFAVRDVTATSVRGG